ncbi:MAG: type II CAAX endopeptidase family protein [Lachnospiraceae bacterium]|nr:type II CAAX endopeptidase family protein [Lachnospiraceae bacterium]
MKNVTKTNVLFAATVLVYIILMYSLALIPHDKWSFNMSLVIPEIILLIPALVYVIVLRPKTVDGVSMEIVSPLTTILTVILTFLIMPLVMLINSVSSLFVENGVEGTLNSVVNENPLWLNLVVIALLPAVVEEFIFRGLIFNGYKRRNPLMAIILSALLFGFIHMNINQFTYAFAIGVIFGLMAYATGSLLPSIMSHFIINGTSVVITHMSADTTKAPVATEVKLKVADYVAAYTVMAIVAVAGLALAYFVFKCICNKNRGFENVKRIFMKPHRNQFVEAEGKFFDGYLLLGVGICLLHMIMYEISSM